MPPTTAPRPAASPASRRPAPLGFIYGIAFALAVGGGLVMVFATKLALPLRLALGLGDILAATVLFAYAFQRSRGAKK